MINRRRVLTVGSALAMLSTSCFAGQVQGLVEKIDPLTDMVVIKDPVTDAGQAVHVPHKVLDEIRIGSVVKATLRSGSDKVETLEVITVG